MRKAAWTFYGLAATLLVLSGLLWSKHSAWLSHANAHLLGASADAQKSNFTSLWHIRRDATGFHCSGINAPWGDHVTFAGGQPLYANGIRWLGRHFSFVKDRSLGWLNWMAVIGQLAAAACIYLIFRRLHLPAWLAAMASVGLALAAPQNTELVAGRFALGNLWVLPLLFLLLIQYEERPYRRPWSLLIAATVVGSGVQHPYFFALAAVFLTLYQFFQVAKRPTWRHFKKRLAHWVVMVLLPFGTLHFWMNLGHSVMDRPEFLAGFAEGRARPSEAFLPPVALFSEKTGAYIGLLATLFTGWLVARRFLFFEKNWDTEAFHRRQKRFLAGTTFAGLVMLLYALGFPYAWPGGRFFEGWPAPLAQFRGTWKFAWPWFFIGNTLFFYVLWQTARRWHERWLQVLTIAAALAILFLEAFQTQKGIDLAPRPNFFLDKNARLRAAPWLLPIDWPKMQAILPLHFYHEGSENFSLPADPFLFEKTQLTAIETGLPDLGCRSARVSLRQTLQSLQLVGEPMEQPAILDQLPTGEPLAVLLSKKEKEGVGAARLRYAHLLEKATRIWRSDSLDIYRLPLDSIRAVVAERRQKAETEFDNLPKTRPINGWLSTSSEPRGFFSASWDLNPADKFFQGRGALVGNFSDTTELFKMPLAADRYTFSVWQFLAADRAATAQLLVKEIGPGGSETARSVVNLREKLIGIVGSWGLFEFDFEAGAAGSTMAFQVLPKENCRLPLFFDELMVRPAGTDFYKKADGWVAKNNRWYRK